MSGLTIAEKRLLVPADLAAEGRGKVQLFDAITQKIVEEQSFENFIGPVGLAYQKFMNRRTFNVPTAGQPAMQDSYEEWESAAQHDRWVQNSAEGVADPQPIFPFNGIVVTSQSDAEDAANERQHMGALIGWANRRTYSGTDTMRGTPNPSESLYTPSLVKHVFDWPTNAAIGTFRSIGWAWLQPNTANGTPSGPAATHIYVRGYSNGSTVSGGNGIYQLHWDPVLQAVVAYGFGGGLRVREWGDGASTIDWGPNADWTVNLPYGIITGFARVGNEWFVRDYNSRKVYVFNAPTTFAASGAAGASTRNFMVSTDAENTSGTDAAKKLASDGTSLYVQRADSGANTVVDRVDPTTGAVAQTYQVPRFGGSLQGMTYDPVRQELVLLVTTSSADLLYRVSRSTGAITGTAYGWGLVTGGLFIRYDQTVDKNVYSSNGSSNLYRYAADNLGSRTLLGADVTKSALQTMKITYQFDFV